MSKKVKPSLTTKEIIRRLNLMHDSGGMLTKDRLYVIEQAAERLFTLDERIDIMTAEDEVSAVEFSATLADIIPEER